MLPVYGQKLKLYKFPIWKFPEIISQQPKLYSFQVFSVDKSVFCNFPIFCKVTFKNKTNLCTDPWVQSLVVRGEILDLGTQDPVYYEGEGGRIVLNQKNNNYNIKYWTTQ